MISDVFTYKTPLRGQFDVNTYNPTSPTFYHHICCHYYEGDCNGPHEGVTKPIPSVVEGVF